MPRALFAAALLLACATHATQAGEILPGDHQIDLDEWREMTDGRTVWYTLDGQHWGREYFHPGTDSATFVSANGDCATAPWVYADGVFCFAYTGMDCFRHIRRGDQLLAVPLSDGATQVIEKITDGPLSCEPPLSS